MRFGLQYGVQDVSVMGVVFGVLWHKARWSMLELKFTGGFGFGFRVSEWPVGSYPTPFLGYLLFYTTDPNHRTRCPKKGVGYEPLGRLEVPGLFRRTWSLGYCLESPSTRDSKTVELKKKALKHKNDLSMILRYTPLNEGRHHQNTITVSPFFKF